MIKISDLLSDKSLTRLETRLLLSHVLCKSEIWLIIHNTAFLSDKIVRDFNTLKYRRLNGEPIAYLIGYKEFMGHMFHVTPDVLIPRPETEILVEKAIEVLTYYNKSPSILDLGTGSGAIAISIAMARPDAKIFASDISKKALKIAEKNSNSLNAYIKLIQGSWFETLNENDSFDLIISNPPYIHCQDICLKHRNLRYEPRIALTDEYNGLRCLKHIIIGSKKYLKMGASLWLEHSPEQANILRDQMHKAGFYNIRTYCDLAGMERISGGTSL